MNLSLITKILNNLDSIPDSTLMMSYKNCHIDGLHSIVLNNNMGKLTRFFYVDKSHTMHKNLGTTMLSLGVHDHKYDLTLTNLFGRAINVNFSVKQVIFPNKGNVSSYTFSDGKATQCGEVMYTSRTRLNQENIECLTNSPLFIDKDSLHTVYVPKDEAAAWLVEEGDEIKNHTTLYTNSPVTKSISHYERFSSADEVRKFIRDIFVDIV